MNHADKDELLNPDDPKSLMEFLKQPTIKIAEFLTGVLVSDKKDAKLSAGHLVQAVIKGDLFTQLGREVKEYQEKGQIKENILETDFNRASVKEILDFIDSEAPDEIRFSAMKSIFLSSMEIDSDEILAYELMQICKKLSSGEITTLKAIHEIKNGDLNHKVLGVEQISGANIWLINIANQVGHSNSALIELHEDNLMALKLISSRRHSDRSGIEPGPNNRLTALGEKLCEFITKYEQPEK